MARSRNSVDALLSAALAGLNISPAQPLAIAFSGGLDSSVLLHAAVSKVGAGSVVALHVHHGLQPAADAWVTHCANQAAALGVRFECLRVAGQVPAGENVEGWARSARYQLLYAACRAHQTAALLTAHHADDQLETVLLAMARGSGLDGLCGIAPRDVREGVLLLRPFLDLQRTALVQCAEQAGMRWVDDPTNADVRLRRNALRHQVIPVLTKALPGLGEQLSGVLAQLRQAQETLQAQAQADLQAARCAPHRARAFDRRVLQTLSDARIAMALRAWLRELGCNMPTAARLKAMQQQLIDASGAQAECLHEGQVLRRYRDCVFALTLPRGHAPPAPWRSGEHALAPWGGQTHIEVPGAGRLQFLESAQGLSPQWLRGQSLLLRVGNGLDRLRPLASGRARTLRNLWQEAGIDPWLRRMLPVLCVQDRVLVAAPFGMDRSGDWPWTSPGITIDWSAQGSVTPAEFALLGEPAAIE